MELGCKRLYIGHASKAIFPVQGLLKKSVPFGFEPCIWLCPVDLIAFPTMW